MDMRDLINLTESLRLDERHADVIEALRPYAKDPLVFIHFTDTPKLGIHPNQPYGETPLGIYGYPLANYWDEIEKYGWEEGGIIYGDRKYVVVFRCVSDKVKEMGSYTETDLERDYGLLRDAYADLGGMARARRSVHDPKIAREISDENFERAFADGAGRSRSAPIYRFWAGTSAVAHKIGGERPHVVWMRLLRRCGYDGFIDRGTDSAIIYPSEMFQGVFFTTAAIKLLEILPNITKVER